MSKTEQATEPVKKCYDCEFWRGICAKGRKNVIAQDDTCSDFKPKIDSRCAFLRCTA